MKDVIEQADITFDDKYELLKYASDDNYILELRKVPIGHYRYSVMARTEKNTDVAVFWFKFFANSYFKGIMKKHDLKEKDVE